MAKHKLAPVALTFTEIIGPGQQRPAPSERKVNGRAPIDYLQDYLQARYQQLQRVDSHRKGLQVERHQARQNIIDGRFFCGPWGLAQRLVDINGRIPDYDQVPSQAALVPFYFAIAWSAKSHRMYGLLQKVGNSGLQGVLEYDINTYLKEHAPTLRVEISAQAPGDFIDRLLESSMLKAVSFIMHEVPADAFAEMGGLKETSARLETTVVADRRKRLPKGWMDKIKDMVSRASPEVRGVTFLGQPYDDVKFKVRRGSEEITVDIGRLDFLRPTLPLDGKCAIEPDGHPNFESLSEYGRNECRTAMEMLDW